MSWLYLDEADPNRVRQLVPIGWEGTVRTDDGTELDAVCEYHHPHGVAFYVAGSEGDELIENVAACEVS